jgi:hypothetical protein
MAISNPASFRAEARWQRVCANCGSHGPFHAHHIVPKRLLRRLKLPLWDTRNALRLCHRCHMQIEWGGVHRLRVPAENLPDQSLCYIYEALGAAAMRVAISYPGIDLDPRMTRHFIGDCPLCQ